MNKLEVALKLLQLLSDRKAIDSKVVAHELHVSLRTAQRYLMELSILPCVRTNASDHSYYLDPDNNLHPALTKSFDKEALTNSKIFPKLQLDKTICLICGSNRRQIKTGMNVFSTTDNISNISKIDRLTAIISKRLRSSRCAFPR